MEHTCTVWYAKRERVPKATVKKSARYRSAIKTRLCSPYCSYGCYVNKVVLSSLLSSFCSWDCKVQFESQCKAQGLPQHRLYSTRHDGRQSSTMKTVTPGGAMIVIIINHCSWLRLEQAKEHCRFHPQNTKQEYIECRCFLPHCLNH